MVLYIISKDGLVNRNDKYSESNRTKKQYRITRIPIKKDLDKSEQLQELNPNSYKPKIEVINFSSKLKQKNGIDLFTNSIFGVGQISDSKKNYSDDNVSKSDFLFFDFEEHEENPKELLSFEECIKILKDNNLNHVLMTSYSHTEEKPRLHLFLPLLSPITNRIEYRFHWEEIYNEYFGDYDIDIKCKNISRWCYSSKSSTLEYSIEFTKDDLELVKLNEEQLKGLQSNFKRNNDEYIPPVLSDDSLKQFVFQVGSMYKMSLGKCDSNGVLKFRRDSSDRTPNVWYPTSYTNGLDKYTIMDNKNPYRVMFSYDDFMESINPHIQKEIIQKRLQDNVTDWFFEGGKKYVITNEGLGKSSTILRLGKKFDFVFVCHSNDRMLEVSKYLRGNNIKYHYIISNTDILREFELDDLVNKYQEDIDKKKKISFKKLINDNVSDEDLKGKIMYRYEDNLLKLQTDNSVRLVTSNKLKWELYKENFKGEESNKWYVNQRFVFDEFNFNEWSKLKVPEEGEHSISYPSIWTNDNYVNLNENEFSFVDLLEYSKNVLLLTTERGVIQTLLYDSDYTELRVFDNKFYDWITGSINELKFEQKMFDDSVFYVLTNTTKKDQRDSIIKEVQKDYGKPLYVISNNSILRNSSHLGVKGRNDLMEVDTLVVGTFRTQEEDTILYYSSETFFNKYEKTHSKKEVRGYINEISLISQVSQSIGRNSGFRSTGSKTIVVLPILFPNTSKVFKPINMNYVTPNVQTMIF